MRTSRLPLLATLALAAAAATAPLRAQAPSPLEVYRRQTASQPGTPAPTEAPASAAAPGGLPGASIPMAGAPAGAAVDAALAGLDGGDPDDILPPGTPLGAAGPQGIGLPSLPNFGEVMDLLKGNAMGAVRGCDYQKYLNLANGLVSSMKMISQLDVRDRKSWGVPSTDYVTMFFRGGGTLAQKKTAKAEATGLVYNLEQVCNAVAQADHINRQYQIVKAGSFNIGNAVKWLEKYLGMRKRRANGTDQRHLLENWDNLYTRVTPDSKTQEDSTWYLVAATLKQTLQSTAQLDSSLDAIDADVQKTAQELVLYADPQASTTSSGGGAAAAARLTGAGSPGESAVRYTCPEGYPDPNRPDAAWGEDPKDHVTKPICGPASPERSVQIMAHLELLKLQLRSLQLRAGSRGLQVSATRLAVDNDGRRVKSAMHYRGQMLY